MSIGKKIKKKFKKALKRVKSFGSAPFHFVRDVSRGVRDLGQAVGNLAQGDFKGALDNTVGAAGNVGKGAIDVLSFGTVSEGGLVDTKVKQEVVDTVVEPKKENAVVSFADASNPGIILGADEVEEDLRRRKRRKDTRGFLGGIDSASGNLLI